MKKRIAKKIIIKHYNKKCQYKIKQLTTSYTIMYNNLNNKMFKVIASILFKELLKPLKRPLITGDVIKSIYIN